MLPCNSIEAALRRPLTQLHPSSPSLPLCTVQQQQHVSRWLAKKENSGNIKFYESFTQIATLLPINASPARSKVVATSAPSPTALPLPSLCSTPFCNCFLFRFVCNFYIVAKCFRFNALIFILRTHKKVVCSPFNRPPPTSLSLLHSPPLPCNRQPFSNAAQHSRCHCSLRLCRLY